MLCLRSIVCISLLCSCLAMVGNGPADYQAAQALSESWTQPEPLQPTFGTTGESDFSALKILRVGGRLLAITQDMEMWYSDVVDSESVYKLEGFRLRWFVDQRVCAYGSCEMRDLGHGACRSLSTSFVVVASASEKNRTVCAQKCERRLDCVAVDWKPAPFPNCHLFAYEDNLSAAVDILADAETCADCSCWTKNLVDQGKYDITRYKGLRVASNIRFVPFKDLVLAFTVNSVWSMHVASSIWQPLTVPLPKPDLEGGVCALVARDSLWAFGSSVYSTDGDKWTLHQVSGLWTPRISPMCTVYNEKMVVVGGRCAGGGPCEDVIVSQDGKVWSSFARASDDCTGLECWPRQLLSLSSWGSLLVAVTEQGISVMTRKKQWWHVSNDIAGQKVSDVLTMAAEKMASSSILLAITAAGFLSLNRNVAREVQSPVGSYENWLLVTTEYCSNFYALLWGVSFNACLAMCQEDPMCHSFSVTTDTWNRGAASNVRWGCKFNPSACKKSVHSEWDSFHSQSSEIVGNPEIVQITYPRAEECQSRKHAEVEFDTCGGMTCSGRYQAVQDYGVVVVRIRRSTDTKWATMAEGLRSRAATLSLSSLQPGVYLVEVRAVTASAVTLGVTQQKIAICDAHDGFPSIDHSQSQPSATCEHVTVDEDGAWDGRKYLLRSCLQKEWGGNNDPRECLAGQHIVFMGDSMSRYQYLSLVHLINFMSWAEDLEERNFCSERSWRGSSGYDAGLQHDDESAPSHIRDHLQEHGIPNKGPVLWHSLSTAWSLFYNGTTSALAGREVCDCFRSDRRDGGGTARFENRFYYNPEWDISLTFIQSFGKYDSSGHIGHINWTSIGLGNSSQKDRAGRWKVLRNSLADECPDGAGTCDGNALWRYSVSDTIKYIIGPLRPSILIYNIGFWHRPSLPSDSDFIDGVINAGNSAIGANSCWWRTTTAPRDDADREKYLLSRDYFSERARQAGWKVFDAGLVTGSLPLNARSNTWWDKFHFRCWVYNELNKALLNIICDK